MKINKEKEYIAEKVYEKVELIHGKDLLERIDNISKLKHEDDLEELTNKIKEENMRINIQCIIVEYIMQEDWSLEEVITLDWLVDKRGDNILKDLVEFIIDIKNQGFKDMKANLKLALKTLYTLGEVNYEKSLSV